MMKFILESRLLIGMTFAANLTISTSAKAQEYCTIKPTERTFFSHPVANLDRQIQ